VTPLAYFLIVVIPLSAFVTIAFALRPGRPAPGRTWTTPAIKARMSEIDAQAQPSLDPANAKTLLRERRKLQAELMRRGLGR
jgi:hypothetical protein